MSITQTSFSEHTNRFESIMSLFRWSVQNYTEHRRFEKNIFNRLKWIIKNRKLIRNDHASILPDKT